MIEEQEILEALSLLDAHRVIAEHARLLANGMQDPAAREILEKLADDHEKQACALEAFVKARRWLH